MIVIVDDDEAVRLSVSTLLNCSGLRTKLFNSGDEFIAARFDEPVSCILLDLHMPGTGGMAVLRVLKERGDSSPILVITAHGDIAVAVAAMKLGASDFIEKPYAADDLLFAINRALASGSKANPLAGSREAAALVAALTDRQRQVLRGILRGEQNKIIAFKLGLSIRTIEAYRSQLLSKLGVRGTAEAVRLALTAGLVEEAPAGPPAGRPPRAAARPPTPDEPYVGFRAHR